MGANISREHHLVPKYWLRAFAEDGHVLGRWRSGAEHHTPVRRAAVARDFNTDPLAEGERRVALETYLDHHVDGPCAPVLRAVREGRWPLDGTQHALVLDALAWQVVRTQAFRSFDAGRPAALPSFVGFGGSGFLRGTAGAAPVGRGADGSVLDGRTHSSRPFRGR
ncbi:DUF4238 domain-containing protein [Streptomyces sp. NPDC056154]|uniref:DUF4238 domain-containing protein n=1 Tax=unclassified Streptomyces TaxID=2593676 RepID=UPI0035E0C543